MAEYKIEPKGFYQFLAKKTDEERGKAVLAMAIAMVEGKPAKLSWIKKIGKPRKIIIPKEYTEDFIQFWKAYHPERKSGKRKAFEAWVKNGAKIDECIKALEWQSRTDAWTKDNGQYFPLAATWLNAMRWEDEDPEPNRAKKVRHLDMNGVWQE